VLVFLVPFRRPVRAISISLFLPKNRNAESDSAVLFVLIPYRPGCDRYKTPGLLGALPPSGSSHFYFSIFAEK
jgi:hypothetical protein